MFYFAINNRLKPFIDLILEIDLGLFSGMRCGEILALTPNDIDLKNNIIHITKTVSHNKKGELIINSTKTDTSMRDIPITELFKKNIKHSLSQMKINPLNLIV